MNYQLASIRQRVFGYLLDSMLLEFISYATVAAIFALFRVSDLFLLIVLGFCCYLGTRVLVDILFTILLPWFTTGKTIGKALMNTRIAKLDGGQVRITHLIVRSLTLLTLTAFFGVFGLVASLFIMLLSKSKQGVHDQIAKTIVIKSKTSRKKLITFWIAYVLTVLISTTVIVLAGVAIVNNVAEQENSRIESFNSRNVSLSGVEGPLAEIPQIDIFDLGTPDYYKAATAMVQSDYITARKYIDEAHRKSPESLFINAYRCYVYTEALYTYEPYEVCAAVLEKSPNNPAVIGNQIINAHYFDECDEVNRLSIHLSNLRMGAMLGDEDLSTYYGNAGSYLVSCEVNPELSNKMIAKAIELTSNESFKEFYRDYLIDEEVVE